MLTAIAAIALLSTEPTARLVAQLGHSAPIHAVAYSPDGRLVVTASQDATAVVWDAATGHELRTLAGHTDDIDAVAISPDGQLVVTGSRDKTAKLWNLATGSEERTLPHGNGWIVAVAFSPDGQLVLTGGWDSTVTFWNAATGEPVRTLSGFEKGVSSIAVSPDGRTVLTGSSDHTARLWDAASGAALRTLAGHTNTVSAVAFSPDSRLAATASWDHTVRIWDVANGNVVRTLTRHVNEVTSLAFSPDGRRLLSGGRDMKAILWDVESGKPLGEATGHTDWVASVAFSPDGRYLLTGSHDKAAKRWDSRGDSNPLTFTARSSGLWATAYSPDCRFFAIGGRDGTATLWDVATGQPVRSLTGHEHWVTSIAFAPDGKSVATASWDHSVRVWSVDTGTLLRTFRGHEAAVTSVVFSPDGRLLATRAWDKSAKVWSVETGAEVHAFAANETPVDSITFSPDSRFLITGWNAAARVWDTTTWQHLRVIGPHTIDFELRAVAFSPDARVLLTASGDGTVKLWNVKSGATLRTLNAHADEVRSAVFSADGHFILTAGSDRTAKLWNASTGAEIRTFAGHTGLVNAATFSCGGKFILTASDDGTARLWESGSGKALATLIAFGGEEWAVVDRDGRFDASNGGDVSGLHWVMGDDVIALRDLASRYYDPELLAKLLAGKEGLLDVETLERIPPRPEVSIALPAKGSTRLGLTVRNRGGGIGNVRVLLNGKEIADDACGTREGTTKESVVCVVDLAAAHLRHHEENSIEVFAWNRDGTVEERGAERLPAETAPGEKRPPTLYAIVVGISEYASPALRKLAYAAPDANSMARAIEIAGRGLFGAERVHVTRLVTGDPLVQPPTKKNLRAAFKAVEHAGENDVLFVYLAGHGTTVGSDYVFPTAQATTSDLRDSAARQRDAVTGTELIEWIKKIPANKQVMVVDTCAAGAVGEQLQSRSERSSITRAMEQLSNRTGFHVLMGSAADAASWESGRLGQGLLTHALLFGMKGAALQPDGIVEVSKLFGHAVDQVPVIAKRIGRSQYPRIAAPRGSSFPIGRIEPEQRKEIPAPLLRPVVLRPLLVEAQAGRDVLGLTSTLKDALFEHSYAKSDFDMVEGDDYPDAIRPEGTYTVDGPRALVRVVLTRDHKPFTSFEVEAPASDVQSLTEKVKTAICEAIVQP